MPRHRRVVIPNCPHHITQRGNNQRDVFFSDADRDLYLKLLKEYTRKYEVEVLGYCLMTNHVHVIATPSTANGLAKALGRTHNDYARCLHIRRRESGHLWQSRFFSCAVEQRYLWAVLAYVERNPMRAGLISRCEDWPWSTARAHLNLPVATGWLSLASWARNWTPGMWRVALAEGLDEAEVQSRLAEATKTGRPLGEDAFVQACEGESGVILRKRKPGPKVKAAGR
jgi:putative transposase